MKDNDDIILKILSICTSILLIAVIYSYGIVLYCMRDRLDYQEYSSVKADALYTHMMETQASLPYENLSNYEIKERIQRIIQPKVYIETYCKRNGGLTRPILRVIEIGDDLYGYDYGVVLMHEYIHLVLMYSDESLTDFLTVKYL